MTSLNVFKSTVGKLGLAPTNRFQMLFTPPPKMSESISNALGTVGLPAPVGNAIGGGFDFVTREVISLYCKQSKIPSSAFNVATHHTNGRYWNSAMDRDYDPVTMQFYCDTKLVVYQFFKTWQDIIRNPFNNSQSYPREYQSAQSTLLIYDHANLSASPSQNVSFVNMFPSEVGEIVLDWENENEVMIFPVTFHYEYFYNGFDEGAVGSIMKSAIRALINSQISGIGSVF